MKNLFALLALILFMGGGCVINNLSDNNSSDVWRIEGQNYEEVTQRIAPWATETFVRSKGTTFGTMENTSINAVGSLELTTSHVVRVIDIPDHRNVEGYSNPTEPNDFFVYVLKDENGTVFRTFVQSLEDKVFKATAFGPALDRRSGASLDTWPSPELQHEAQKAGAELVMIPYPYPMNQVYYLFGTDIENARLVNVESGIEYNGLTDLLDSIDEVWASLK